MAKPRLACRECHYINMPDSQACENCGASSLTEDWAGYVVITHPEESDIATEMNVTEPGGYALKVR
ncbi:DNA-directed RNA polymerase, subunit E'' [Halogeometricum borinquense]|uniref:Transcription elongation factor Spt4 n=2 Tax=Halogeometricum borinquense TaxID=60847 RepID=E4NM05_HALBP|nr:transcription elongation factor subunit Spt4 [Halogeometricum borinquense]ADQ66104.1 DNA-directed RNA polymerase, subunit E'' [Halogeometricum borinquense DSM 11551]ELY27400.1 DNA-directed RNA polymerase, subunit e'' [Halogeometricum borinquense DSM 11551]QIB75917.1 DNA-directed RNA polymerase, subunit E'' [Halogeometricum borinquense]QIQ75501.1 DNA-directed RNA polymerase, subunit E'' [Halogeometricum borinquense]RYJ13729.1 DNA-directed RNA polymerase, subunit E'' [Halogeometricum borinque